MPNARVRDILQQNLNWIVIALFFFALGIVATAFLGGNENLFLGDLTDSQQKLLEELAEIVFGGSVLRGILFLFINNLFASLQMMLLGVIVGLPPLLGLFTNGAILGSLAATLTGEGIPLLAFTLRGILPHGIFEIPAFIISAGFGLKIGFHILFPLPGKRRGESFVSIWREYWSVFPLLLNLFILAATCEVLITPHLIKQLF